MSSETQSRQEFFQAFTPKQWSWTQPKPHTLCRPIRSSQCTLSNPGLIGFVFHCWANELPMELSPSVLHDRLLSELTTQFLKHKDVVRSLFTTQTEGKQDLIVRTSQEHVLPIDVLIESLEQKIPSKDILAIARVSYSTDTEVEKLNRQITLCQMAAPYYNYLTTKCGIPSVRFSGTNEDWFLLRQTIHTIMKLTVDLLGEDWSAYLSMFASLVAKMDSIRRGHKDDEFVSTIFSQEKNTNCMSGHKQTLVSGWLLGLYFDHFFHEMPLPNDETKTSEENQGKVELEIGDFPGDVHFVAYENIDTQRQFFQYSGLLSTRRTEDGFEVAVYEDGVEEVFDEALFCMLAQKELTQKKESKKELTSEEDSKSKKELTEKTKKIHPTVTCDGCGMFPLKGERFKCNECKDYDLCDICIRAKSAIHPEHTDFSLVSVK